MSTSYAETFVTLPIVDTKSDDDELTIPASKIQAIRGNKRRSTVTYRDGETVTRVEVTMGASAIRDLVLPKMTDF